MAIAAITPPFSGTSQAIDAMRVTSNIFDPLIFKDPKSGNLTPGLVTEWKQLSPTVTDLTVRRGVKFHDGTPMTADDVAFTLSAERLWGPNAIEPSVLASTLSKVEVKAPDTVEITTSQPDPALLDRLASPIGYVVPKAYLLKVGLQQFGVHPIGTGPYKVQSITPGESVDLTANPDYWGPKPTYKSVTFDQVSDVTARVSGLATGRYDIATSIPPDQSEQVKRNGQEVVSTTVNNVLQLAFMTNQAGQPTSDPRVRQAMQLAIDRQGIAESLWNGQATVPDGFNLPTYAGFYDSNIPVLKQDVAQAKALLASARYSGQPITLQYIGNYYTNLDLALQAMLPMWNSAGLNVVLQPVANFTMLDYKKLQVYATSSNLQLGDDHRRAAALNYLERAEIPDVALYARRYPHQLSGGLAQRVLLAAILAASPSILIADEPTSALDVTTQARIAALLRRLVKEDNIGMILITHDLTAAAQIADDVAVMYQGRIVEQGAVRQVLEDPRHEYTRRLVSALPGRRYALRKEETV